jgi:uncharacterized protein involved in type VI secretion and phage assembly
VIEELMPAVVERFESRFFGKHRAVVVDNADPKNLGRLKLQIPNVLGEEVVSGWATPCVSYGGAPAQGFFFIPEVGASVWVEFEAGNLEYPVWVGTFWGKPSGAAEMPKPNDPDGTEQSDVQSPPTRKIIKTLKGHTIQLEDADGDEMVLIVEIVDADKKNVITLNADGIKVTDGANGTDSNKQEIILDSNGIKLTDKTGNVIEMSTSAFTITSKVAFNIDASGQAITIKGSTIDLNKA